jgi:hypothetical protein
MARIEIYCSNFCIYDRHIGGCDDMMALDRSGQLDPLLGT